jgi:oxygen-independent coproporphyrinogen-3 oxidase
MKTDEKTEVGSYFISNYPPFSFWKKEFLPQAERVLDEPCSQGPPLGLYLHIPFCRKRCKFCYFRVYTDKNSRDVERYVAALAREIDLYRTKETFRSRPIKFAYFGGGTPSFLSAKQLESLVERLRASVSWDDAEEVTFECEPGTLSETKLRTIRDIGVTRLSLGVENFSDKILEENGRAHQSPEVFQAYEWARAVGFEQINIDLISGMVGETWENWRECVKKTIALEPDSLTVYQMELPFNAIYSKDLAKRGVEVADWKTKRDWVDYAFSEMEKVGYQISSAYTVVKSSSSSFVYRDAVWHGADMVGAGVASFSHVGGVHYQNVDTFEAYTEALEEGRLPLGRGLEVTPRQRLIREMILQLKLGRLERGYFKSKFGADILEAFGDEFEKDQKAGFLKTDETGVTLSRAGLLRVDSLLPDFFEPAHRGARYT